MKLCLDESRLTGTNLLLIFKKGIRDRITQVVKCYVNTNNKCIKEQYNPTRQANTSVFECKQPLRVDNDTKSTIVLVFMGKSRRFYL